MSAPTRTATPPERRELFWIDVLDHRPDDHVDVLVFSVSDKLSIKTAWHTSGIWYNREKWPEKVLGVTHWMDIPAAPTPSPLKLSPKPKPPTSSPKNGAGKTGVKTSRNTRRATAPARPVSFRTLARTIAARTQPFCHHD